jgi:SAM-dependent methyltransferase
MPIRIPDRAVEYILLQRTRHLRIANSALCERAVDLFPFPIHRYAVKLDALIGRQRVKSAYSREIEAEFAQLRDFLPKECAALLDIGCGVAGIDVLLYGFYGTQRPSVHLLDRTRTAEQIRYGFRERASFYNSLEVAKLLLESNGVPSERVDLLEATDSNEVRVNRPLDLVISLLSWGFHYPIETYLDKVYGCLADGGRLILDVRRGTGGMDLLRRAFGNSSIIDEGKKHDRALFVKEG